MRCCGNRPSRPWILAGGAYVKTAGRLRRVAHIIPGMPMPGPIARQCPFSIPPGEVASRFGLSGDHHFGVINKAAIETASCRASRTTLAANRECQRRSRSSYSPLRQ